jgi:hypothetical protein
MKCVGDRNNGTIAETGRCEDKQNQKKLAHVLNEDCMRRMKINQLSRAEIVAVAVRHNDAT